MSCRILLAAFVAATLGAAGCASLGLPTPSMPTTAKGDPKTPGTPAWWKKHKNTAELVPGRGYRVEGTDGYFDQNGLPINSRVAKVVEKKDEAGGLLNDAGFLGGVNSLKEVVGLGPDQSEAQRQYELGEANFRGKKFDDAAENYEAAAKGWPNSSLEQDALFAQGESLFFGERYPKANDAYEKLLKKFPNSRHMDKAITRQFAIARYWEQYADYDPDWVTNPNLTSRRLPLFDTLGRAIKVYENIRLNDPTGPLADDAIMATANSYFRRGRFNDADYQYDLLRKEYPRSDHFENANVLGLQCKLRRYQGPDYDGTPLEDAQKLVKQQRTQSKLDPEYRTKLAEIEGQILKELATREFKMAQHFDEIEEYGSAKFYYAEVVKNYASTPLADQARERLAALGDEPDRPEVKLAWLINKLPENSERTAVAQVPLIERATPDLGVPGANTPMMAEGPAGTTNPQGGASSGPTVLR
jgi:outer membrane protein assembly factor BamD (BamD/ComL family)